MSWTHDARNTNTRWWATELLTAAQPPLRCALSEHEIAVIVRKEQLTVGHILGTASTTDAISFFGLERFEVARKVHLFD